MMKAKIIVTPKKSVLDPQGEAVKRAIHGLGMDCVEKVRIGKFIELEISGKNYDLTKAKLEQISHDLLSNPVIEDYTLELTGEGKPVVKVAAAKVVAAAPKKAKKDKKDKAKGKKDKKEKKEKKKDKKGKKKK